MAAKGKAFDVKNHELVPKHEICSAAELKRVKATYSLDTKNMPRILSSDPGIQHLKVKPGDIIKISRPSFTAGETVFFRTVVEG